METVQLLAGGPKARYFSRSDVHEPLGTFSKHAFFLDDMEWPSVEHYYQAMKCENDDYRQKVQRAAHPKAARKQGRSRFIKLRKDWRKIKTVVMTRAIYTMCRTHPDVAKILLETGEDTLVESSNYDYFWGCGRDRRGSNHYGKVLMSVREKLKSEATSS